MPLTDAQRDQAAKHLRRHLRNPCSVCGIHKFTIVDLVNTLPFDNNGAIVLGGPSIPTLLVVCDNCFHLLSFAAVPMGLVPSDSKPPGEPAKETK
jgi:hypothetical protein